ncbi:MAG TPA: FtsX-like permease family protein [Bacteroidota bacterium]|nr:FtsX-like permease family protein [Bacteroidota bacterium]
MLILKLALRNILHAGLRTWLNVVALSFAFVAIVFLQGFYDGLNDQVERSTVDALYGGGQYWQNGYNPYDPLSLEDAHAVINPQLQTLIDRQKATPILIRTATIYPQGRFRSIILKGIDPDQTILSLPTSLLKSGPDGIPGIIGNRMAKSAGLKKGDLVTVQWRDVHGTFDARDVRIVEVFSSTVQDIDNEQIWIPLRQLQQFTRMEHQATIVVLKQNATPAGNVEGWDFKNLNVLLQDLHSMVRMKRVQGSIMYLLLLFLAMLAIFDTQVLSIWRRRKEMGTLMALGMTRTRIIELFTLEGAFHSLLAAAVAALYGIPLLAVIANKGFALPSGTDNFGFAIGEKLFPTYSPELIIGTTVVVCVVTTIVSYLPTRKIADLKPTDALRGKLS